MDTTHGATAGTLLESIREILHSSDYESPDQRKAALRRALHASSVGLTEGEARALLSEVESRYPDRVYESSSKAAVLARRAEALEKEAAETRAEMEQLRTRARALDRLVATVVEAARRTAATDGAPAGAPPALAPDPSSLAPLFDAVARLLAVAVEQEAIVREFESTMERKPGRQDAGSTLPAIFARLAAGEPAAAETGALVERRLKALGKFPAALISGAQQSWRSGTTSVLKSLDPGSGEGAKPKWLQGGAALQEIRGRFKSFWDQLDLNIAHYYRGTFERVYAEVMEDRR